jgi:hypothetical protein
MFKHLILLLFGALGSLLLNAQIPAIEWQNTLGSNSNEYLGTIHETSDGGYIVGGESMSNMGSDKSENSLGNYDFWILKVDSVGSLVWENTIGGGLEERFGSIVECPDGGFIAIGYSISEAGVGDKTAINKGGYDYWVVKLDENGVVEWDKSYGGNQHDQGESIQPTSDGGYILAGISYSGISGDKTEICIGNSDFWVIKIDSIGNIIWQNDIGGLMTEYLYTAYETTDGGYILGGQSFSGISGDKTTAGYGTVDYWIVQLDSLGTIVWDKTIGGSLFDYLYAVIPTADGGSLASGSSGSGISGIKTENTNGSNDLWLVKLDISGNITWQNTIGGSASEHIDVYGIEQTFDGGYIIAAYSNSPISGDITLTNKGESDYWILKLDSLGNILWQTKLGGMTFDHACAISVTTDEGYIVGGYSRSGIGGDKDEESKGWYDYWIIKLAPECLPAAELCNTIDDNCNGLIDDAITETISISAGGPITFCQGSTVLLTATYSGATVQWKKNGTNMPGATSATYNVTTKGNYSCVTTSACDTVESTPIFVNVIKNPNASISAGGPTTFCAGGSVALTEVAVAGCTYQWYKGATPIAGATSLTYTATTSGNYKCRVTKAATGCYKNSNAIAVSVPCKEGLPAGEAGEMLIDENACSIYPNPNNGTFTIEANVTTQDFASPETTIEIYNNLGQLIYSEKTNSQDGIVNEIISIGSAVSGIYLLKIKQGDYIAQSKIVIE